MSRMLFFIFVLANLGLFAWVRLYVSPGSAQLQPSPPPGGKPLQLMSELTPAERKILKQREQTDDHARIARIARRNRIIARRAATNT